jgi:DNA-binding SARP family transcriptional activator
MDPDNILNIRLLGDLEVAAGGSVLPLPQSKKTRALLGYLVLSGRSQRRERRCALFWDVADDPRGALRWSLSKIRSVMGEGNAGRIVSERDSVRFEPEGAWVDVLFAREAMRSGLETLSTDRLAELSRVHRGELLEGLDLSDFHEYQAWCTAQREQSRREHAAILRALISRVRDRPEQALPYARELSQVDALEEEAHALLLRLLLEAGRDIEAEQYHDSARRLLATLAGRASGLLDEVWRERATHAVATRAKEPAPVRTPQTRVEIEDAPLSRAYLQSRLVGREHTIARFESMLDNGARTGHALVMTGEPGVGKSRLVRAFRDVAQRKGGQVLTGRAFETESAHPYAIWLDAFRHLPRAAELHSILVRTTTRHP